MKKQTAVVEKCADAEAANRVKERFMAEHPDALDVRVSLAMTVGVRHEKEKDTFSIASVSGRHELRGAGGVPDMVRLGIVSQAGEALIMRACAELCEGSCENAAKETIECVARALEPLYKRAGG